MEAPCESEGRRPHTLTPNAAAFLWLLVDGMGVKPANILFAGGTGCGKTTTLAAICTFVPEWERVVTIEDVAELRLPTGLGEAGDALAGQELEEVGFDQLVKNALRMRPDRVIIGEARGLDIPTVFMAFSGHTGCMSTIHSNTTAEETLMRITRPPISVPELLISAVDAIVMQRRLFLRGKHMRRVTEIAEVKGIKNGRLELNRTHKWDPQKDELERVEAPSLILAQISEFGGISPKEVQTELQRREEVLKLLVSKRADGWEVYRTIQNK